MNVQLYYYYCNLLALFLLIQLLPPSQTTIIITTTIPTINNNNNNDTNNQTEITTATSTTKATTSFITIQQNNNKTTQEQKIIRRLWSPYTTSPPSLSSSSTSSSTFWTQHSNSPPSEQSSVTTTTTKSPQNTPEQRTTTIALKTVNNVPSLPKIRTVRQSVNRNYVEDDEEEEDDEEDDEDEDDEDEEEEEDDDEVDEDHNDVLNDQVDKEKSTHEAGGGRRRGSRQHNDVESWIQSHKLHSLSSSSSSSSPESHIDSHSTTHGGGSTSTTNSGGGPIISSIRHHKSRKSFQRTRKVKPSSEKLKPTTTASKLISTVFNTDDEQEQEQADQPILHHYPILPTLRSSSSRSLTSSSTDKPFSSSSGTRKLFSPSQQQYQQSFLSKQQEQQQREETSSESLDGKKSEEIRFINNNDSSVVYGKPYFTPFKTQRQQQQQSNVSSLNRIKNFLRNATTNSRPDANNNINAVDRLEGNLERIQDEQAGSRKRKEEEEGISKTSSLPSSSPVDHEKGSKSHDNRARIDAAARTIPNLRNRKTEEETYDEQVYQGTSTTSTTMVYPTRGDTRVRTNRRLKNKQRNNNNNGSTTDASVNAMTNSSSSSSPTRRTKNNNKGIKANKGGGDNQNLNKQSSTTSSSNSKDEKTKIRENNNNVKFPAKGTTVARGSRRKLSGTKNRGEGIGAAGLHDHDDDDEDDGDGGESSSAGTVNQQQSPSDHRNHHAANNDQNRASSSSNGSGGQQSAHENNSETREQHLTTKVSDTGGAGDSEDSNNNNNWWWNDNNNSNNNRRINSADGDGGGGGGSTSAESDFTQHSIIVPGISPEELLKQDAPLTEDNSPYFPESVSKDDNNNSNSNRTTNNINNNSLFNDYNLLGSDEEQEIRDVLQASISPIEGGGGTAGDDEDSSSFSSSPSSSSSGGGGGSSSSSSASSLASSFSSSAASGLHHQSKTKPDIDIVTKFLRIVETQHTLGDNCTAGTAFSLGEGVVDRYAQERFRLEAEIAVNRANMLTRLWKYAGPQVLDSEYLLHASLFSMVEFDDDIFAAGNCYDKLQYKNYTLFCPFAYRLPEGNILVKDLAVEYKYLSNTSEWFYIARKNAERVIKNHNQFSKGFHSYTYNESTHTERVDDEILNVTYDDGKWSKPYFDCGGGNIWMMTYTVPFFGFKDDHYFFKGTSGIDIDLRRVDIDQCPLPENSTELNIFAASDKCKNATTKCVPIKGLGFRRGSYRCVCQPGYYFPNTSSTIKYFNGTVLEEEYEKKLMNEETMYDEEGAFECLKCLEGCDTCVDDRPCVVTLNWLMRSGILILQCAIIAMLPIVGLFTWKYSDIKVVRAASPVLLRFIVLGAFLIYCTILVLYPSPSVFTCTMRIWLREIGFSLAYGALMLKTWRISVIFRVRSAKAVKITDLDLMKRLGVIVAIFTALLVIRTLVAPPVAIVSLTADDLKAWLCKTDWWDHSFTIMELLFLVWGIRLCIVVRKAPSEFNESKFISLAIYNEFLLSVFLNISMLFLQSPANPDLLYIICFCHVQLTMTLLLCLIFGSKAYMVFRGHGKGNPSDEPRVPTFISKNRSGQKPKQPSGQNSTTGMHSSTTSTSHAYDPNFNSRLSEDVQEEFRRLYYQLEELKERNMRFGNRHLVAKIRAMQEAADSILGTNTGGTTTITSSNCHLQPGTEIIGGRGDTGGGNSSSGGGGSSNEEVPASSNVLSDITEEDGVGNNGGGSGGTKDKSMGKDSKKRLSFFGRVKSPKGLVPRRSKSTKTNNNSGSGSDNGGGSTSGGSAGGGSNKSSKKASPIKKALAGSKSAQLDQQEDKHGKKASTLTEGVTGDGATTTKIEDDEDSNNVLLAHGGVYIGEVNYERPAGGVASRGTSIKKSPKPSKQQEPAVVASVQVHPPSSSSSVTNNRNDGNDNDDSALTSTNSKKCDYFQCKDDQGNCSKDTTSTTTGECIAMNVIRLQTGTTATTSSSSSSSKQGGRGGICETVIKSGGGSSETKSGDNTSSGTTSKDRNHTGEKNNSKILLDLNDKSRFTEEITV